MPAMTPLGGLGRRSGAPSRKNFFTCLSQNPFSLTLSK